MLPIIHSCTFDNEAGDVSIPDTLTDFSTTNITIGPDCDASTGSQTISFAHLADLHANFAMKERKFEKLKYFYQQLKEQNPYTIFTNAGDDYEKGSVTEVLSSGKSVKEAIFAMEFDVRTIGNHDFAWGTAELLEYVQDPHAKVLASNTKYIADDGATFAAYDFVQAQVGCVNVGFFGMVSLPWNELDETYDGQFLPELTNDFSYRDISKEIILNFRSQVDILVLVSHLGVVEDGFLADSILGIDLILGGHSHTGIVEKTVGDTLLIQPEFFADGISQIDIDFDLVTQTITSISHQDHNTSDMEDYDLELAQTLDTIADKYAKERHDIIAYAEFDADNTSLANVSLDAIYDVMRADNETSVDIVLLNPNLVWTAWDAGGLSKQDFYNAYNVERQKSDTPGFNSIYRTSITGANIKKMVTQQPLWLYKGVTELDDETAYTVALNKGPAINIPAFFTDDIEYVSEPEFFDENWQVLSDYGVRRTAACVYIDNDNTVIDCIKTEHVLFDFNSSSNPLEASEGVGEMTAYPSSSYSIASDDINTPAAYSIAAANDSSGNVFNFDVFTEDQGVKLSHILEPNGYLSSDNKLSFYTLVFDLYVPSSENEWLAILQTNLLNTDDADLFVHKEGTELEIGSTRYFSGILFNTWQRIAVVVNSNAVEGKTNLYIDGALVGTITHADERWAIESSFLMFADNTPETSSGFIDNILLVNKPLSDAEVQLLGSAKQIMSTSGLPIGLNE
ncbi:hypothetical protein GCM10008107_09450 [Psychrosphaera saromensis]|nr:hypothetical protein GCM10008107_09450 [Psychrosphaera saromensis]GLQ15448.1 hypothetical protein GCM10007917_29030 [Psychrosphaera saromensis]